MNTAANLGTHVVTPTVESVRAACARIRRFVESHHLCLEATIEDYPIGRRERGKCRLQVERARGKGYRRIESICSAADPAPPARRPPALVILHGRGIMHADPSARSYQTQ
jgi:hypothetical protein